MGRKPNYEELYKVTLVFLSKTDVDLSKCDAAEFSRRVDCNKSTLYSHVTRIRTDINCI